MKINCFFLYFCFVFLSLPGIAQDQKEDSLIAIIETLKDDSIKVNTLNELSYSLWDTKPDMSIMYLDNTLYSSEFILYISRLIKGILLLY